MTKQLIKTTKLSKQELRNIRNLTQQCYQFDTFNTRLYWNILRSRQLPEFDDFLYYNDGKLVAYLALFVFKQNEAEISATVHPKFRKQGLFRRLLEDAVLELKRRNIPSCEFICNQKAELANTLLKRLKTEFNHTECEMRLTKKIKLDGLPKVKLHPAGESDLPTLAKIDNSCFNTKFETIMYRFHQNLQEKNRKIWLVTHEGTTIGKIHVRFDDDDVAFIHDVGVSPKHRRKRYASAMVMDIIDLLKKKGHRAIALDVLSDNTDAIKLYEKCGFDLFDRHDFFRLPVSQLYKHLKL